MPEEPPSKRTFGNCSTIIPWARFLPTTGWPTSPSFKYRFLLTTLSIGSGDSAPAQRIPLYDAGYHSDRFLDATSEVDQRRKSKRTDLASRLSLPDAIRSRSKENRQTQSPTKFMNLQIDDLHQFSIYRVFRIQNTIFTHY